LQEEDIIEEQKLINGLTLRVKNGYLLLMIDEENTYFENENFSIEVFEIKSSTKAPTSAYFTVGGYGTLSNGQTLEFSFWDGSEYSAEIDTSVARADSDARTIGTSGVTSNTLLAQSIKKSIDAAALETLDNHSAVQVSWTDETNSTLSILQDAAMEKITSKTGLQGTLFTAGVLTGLSNWDIDPQQSQILRRLYFVDDPNKKASPLIYTPAKVTEPPSMKTNNNFV